MQQSLIIQCSNLFEYRHIKEQHPFNLYPRDQYSDSTYTIIVQGNVSDQFINNTIKLAPTARVIRKLVKKGKAAYIKIKE